MPGSVTYLDPLDAPPDPRGPDPLDAGDHPMRRITEKVAADPDSWHDAQRRQVAGVFDTLAPEWHTRAGPDREAAMVDAFTRGVPSGLTGAAAEVGSGIGLTSAAVARRFTPALAIEIAAEMLRRATTRPAHRVLADGAVLPVADASLAAVVLMNTFLFGPECDRVLAADGVVVWINSRGPLTPIHLPAEVVLAALPGMWEATASQTGPATWCVARRSSEGDP